MTITDRIGPAGLSMVNSLEFIAYVLSGRDIKKQTAKMSEVEARFHESGADEEGFICVDEEDRSRMLWIALPW
jgi:hypothetical protein